MARCNSRLLYLMPFAALPLCQIAAAADDVAPPEKSATTEDSSASSDGNGSTPADDETAPGETSLELSTPEVTTEANDENENEPNTQPNADKGFYLRATLGGGHSWAFAEETEYQPDLSMQALGGGMSLHPGYQLAPGLAVHTDLYGALLFAHRTRPDTTLETDDYDPQGIGMVAFTVGLGVTYHALPSDLFVSAGFGLSEAWGSRWTFAGEVGRTAVITESEFTNPGYAAHGSVGKLFSVHRRWSLGGSLNYNFQTFGKRGDTLLSFERVHSLWLGFTTTFHPPRD